MISRRASYTEISAGVKRAGQNPALATRNSYLAAPPRLRHSPARRGFRDLSLSQN